LVARERAHFAASLSR